MVLGKRYVAGDVVEGYRFAFLPTKVRCQSTQKGYWIWFEEYYLWKKMYNYSRGSYWEIRKLINYDKDRMKKIKEVLSKKANKEL